MRTRNSIGDFVRLLVRLSVLPSVHRSVGPSVRPSRSTRKREKRAFMMLQLVLCMCERVWGGLGWDWDEAGGLMPTRPQRYCDLASLILVLPRAIRGYILGYSNRIQIIKEVTWIDLPDWLELIKSSKFKDVFEWECERKNWKVPWTNLCYWSSDLGEDH